MRRAMDAFAEHYLATYAAIFLPAWTLETVEDDPLRAPVRHLQDDLAAHIERRLAPYADRLVRLDTQATAVDAVVAHVLRRPRTAPGHVTRGYPHFPRVATRGQC